jgi:hypothetical protein
MSLTTEQMPLLIIREMRPDDARAFLEVQRTCTSPVRATNDDL